MNRQNIIMLIEPPPPVPLQQTELNTAQQIEILGLGEDTETNNNCFVKKCLIL